MDAKSSSSADSGAPSTSSSTSAAASALTVAGATLVAAGCAALVSHLRRRSHLKREFPNCLVPLIEYYPRSTKARRIERFGEYVVCQLRIPPEEASAALLAQAADDYVIGDKSRSDKSRDNLLALAAMACPHSSCVETPTPQTSADSPASERTFSNSAGVKSMKQSGSNESIHSSEDCVRELTKKLIQELDTCMLSYCGFHWRNSGRLVQQVFQTPHERLKLKDAVYQVMR